MIVFNSKKILTVFFLFFISSCQLDQSLNVIKESLSDFHSEKNESEDKDINQDPNESFSESDEKSKNEFEKFPKPLGKITKNKTFEQGKFDELNMKDDKDKIAMLPSFDSAHSKEPNILELGVLVPLSGEKRSAGDTVIKTLRFALNENDFDINLKVFDTKGTVDGVSNAIKEASKQGLRVFLGPIFSYETKKVKESFGKKKLLFFSLSTDFKNKSKNVIIAGQNSENQVNCIYNDLQKKGVKKVLLIIQDNIYGKLIKKSLINKNISVEKNTALELEFFTINESKDLNQQIREISLFDQRKKDLEDEIININNSDEQEFEKKQKLKFLQRKLTLGSPFDTIVIATEGNELLEIISHLAFYDINPKNTIFYGTSIWQDTDKKDQVYDGSLFLSNINKSDAEFYTLYKNIFMEEPQSITFRIYDLIKLINEFLLTKKKRPENKLYYGKFANSYLEDGFLHRETFIKKVKNKKNVNLYRCSSNVF